LGPHDLERIHVDFIEGAKMLIDGTVDAQYQRPVPNQVMTDLCARIPVRILRFEPKEIEAALKAVPCDRAILMKKGAITGLSEDIPQLGVLNLLVAHSRSSEELVRLVVQTIIENSSRLGRLLPLFEGLTDLLELTRQERCASLEFDGVRLHPGAARAYADAGYMK
jgi:TRAP-type uncharacterized transport system substrate-binding protein